MKFLNKNYNLGLKKEELQNISLNFGSDIAFFFEDKASIIKGRGEIIENFKYFDNFFIILINPKILLSTKEVFELFTSKASFFLPLTYIYFDDIYMPHHNTKCGELLAIKEFNEENQYRNISYHSFFENDRLFKNAKWVKQIYYFHILDHDLRFNARKNKKTHIIDNPYF